MYKKYPEKKPKKEQLCLIKCPGWCRLGLHIATYDGKRFYNEDDNNGGIDEEVTEWMALNEEGEPE
jgi:hypothetical protein